jgi:hypothetical protein
MHSMNRQLLHIFGAAVLTAAAGHAQTMHKLIVDVPFDFEVGSTQLHAGEYTVDLAASPGVMMLRSSDGQSNAMILATPAESREASPEAKLVFHRYGGEYFLWQVWDFGATVGRQIPQSAHERELAVAAD